MAEVNRSETKREYVPPVVVRLGSSAEMTATQSQSNADINQPNTANKIFS